MRESHGAAKIVVATTNRGVVRALGASGVDRRKTLWNAWSGRVVVLAYLCHSAKPHASTLRPRDEHRHGGNGEKCRMCGIRTTLTRAEPLLRKCRSIQPCLYHQHRSTVPWIRLGSVIVFRIHLAVLPGDWKNSLRRHTTRRIHGLSLSQLNPSLTTAARPHLRDNVSTMRLCLLKRLRHESSQFLHRSSPEHPPSPPLLACTVRCTPSGSLGVRFANIRRRCIMIQYIQM